MSSRPLHILHIVPYFFPAWSYGGIPRLAYGLCRTTTKLGHRVTVLTTDAFDAHNRLPSGTQPRALDDIRIVTLPNLSNTLAYHHQAFLPRGLLQALSGLVGERPDLLHLHGHRHLLNSAARHYANRHRIPYVFTPNGTLPAIERKRFVKAVFDLTFGRRVVSDAHTLIAVSRAEVAQFRAAGISAHRIAEIHNGLDMAEFDPLPHRTAFRDAHRIPGPYVLYLGKLTPRKGVDHLLAAFAQLNREDITLVIAGNDMGVGRRLHDLTRALKIENRVRFIGLVEGDARLAALAGATVLAYPSSLEIFGLVPFEGMMAGAPAVVSDDCGCGELVQKARAGLLVRYGDVDALAASLRTLLENPHLRQRMVELGQSFIRAHLSWDQVGPKTIEVYRRAVEGYGSRSS